MKSAVRAALLLALCFGTARATPSCDAATASLMPCKTAGSSCCGACMCIADATGGCSGARFAGWAAAPALVTLRLPPAAALTAYDSSGCFCPGMTSNNATVRARLQRVQQYAECAISRSRTGRRTR